MMKGLTFLALVGSASAMCAGDTPCSGHGSCGSNDKCSCYTGYTSQDCSQRTCNHHTSWNEIKQLAVVSNSRESVTDYKKVEHQDTECSSKGECDRDSGECKCFEGYTGKGCRRMDCDGGAMCNGHGRCRTLQDWGRDYGWSTNQVYEGWDKNMIQRCDCDAGWAGVACTERQCKKGDDPLTTGGNPEVQVIALGGNTLQDNSGTINTAGEFVLSYTAGNGETYYTWPIDAVGPTAIEIEEALEGLPNAAIPSITVTEHSQSASGHGLFAVTFTDPSNSGDQPILGVTVQSGAASPDGTVNALTQMAGSGVVVFDFAAANTLMTATDGVLDLKGETDTDLATMDGTAEFVTCSNRGHCDTDKGVCECFEGFTGDACQTQTVVM